MNEMQVSLKLGLFSELLEWYASLCGVMRSGPKCLGRIAISEII